ncbi:MAG: nucleotide exchange factor GrpE [Clostridia bacterium]|nr:nucleotide exchange factor GrpE [Clostridia bacterium]MBR5976918.1 nucleotide exchange factor GrpE [Clostridia bacterium]
MFMRRKAQVTKKKVEIETPEEEIKEEEQQEEKAEEQTAEEKLSAELAAQKEAYLRLAAEYDNFRKRTVKEKEESFTNAKSTVFADLLPVLDNFDRALATEDASLEDFKKGVEMTYTQFSDVFKNYGVETFGEPGDQFDPNIHNAVMHEDDESLEANVVKEVFQKGYKIKDKILRPAMVKVAN